MFRDEAASARPVGDGTGEDSSVVTATVASPLLDERRVGRSMSNNDAEQLLAEHDQRQHELPVRGIKAMITAAPPPFDIESSSGGSAAVKLRTEVARPRRSVVLARPIPFEPITDPFAWVCDIARRPKFGHQYVLCPGRSSLSRRQSSNNRVGLSVGPHWSGVIYTMSIIAVATLFLTKFIMKDLAPWYQPATVMCSFSTLVFLLATAVVDPGIVVESGEAGAGVPFCEVCAIWRPEDAEHCEEW